jgi:DNA-binding response OmpR family regulator
MAHILIADDDPLICDLVRELLTADGHVVGIVADGKQALQAIRVKRPDLVLLDCGMPEMSGLEVLRAMRLDEGLRRIPVIMLTARRGKQDVEIAYYTGATAYLKKPFDPDELLFRVEDELSQAGNRAANSEGR